MFQVDMKLESPRPAHQAAMLLACASLLVTSPAWAQADDLFRPYAGYSLVYDDNVLGLPGPEVAAALTGSASTGDRSRSAQVGLQLEKTLGRQHVSLNLGASKVEYDRYSQLDYRGRNFRGVWDWRVGNYLDGSASAMYTRSLAPFDDYHIPTGRLRTERKKRADFRKQFHPRWQMRGGMSRYDVVYAADSQQQGGRKEALGELSMDYVTPRGNLAGIVMQQMNGSYPLFAVADAFAPTSDFTQREVRARVDWKASAKTRFQFTGGVVTRRHKASGAKDFRGVNARISGDWAVSEKVSLAGSAWRELGNVEDLFTAYSLNKGIAFNPQWSITQKLKTDVQLRYDSRDFHPSHGLTLAGLRGDTLRSAVWSVNYLAGPHWLVQLSASHMQKDGRGQIFKYRRSGHSFLIQYQF